MPVRVRARGSRICQQCGTSSTTQWRYARNGMLIPLRVCQLFLSSVWANEPIMRTLTGNFLMCNACGIRWRRKLRGVSKCRRSPPIPTPIPVIPNYHNTQTLPYHSSQSREGLSSSFSSGQQPYDWSCAQALSASRSTMPMPLPSHFPTPYTASTLPSISYPSLASACHLSAHSDRIQNSVALAPLLSTPTLRLPVSIFRLQGPLQPVSSIQSHKTVDSSPVSIQNLLNNDIIPWLCTSSFKNRRQLQR